MSATRIESKIMCFPFLFFPVFFHHAGWSKSYFVLKSVNNFVSLAKKKKKIIIINFRTKIYKFV